ncbi:hypothetical protein M3672_07965 [Microbacterium enclense]|uniref:hypothetical protein n=1 Tax=Microbacterium enclense TaxID=993073 RepID=UPI0020417999|nr:hypothetical protein [Microbacterium enclense]MCM3614375.1 hypothetical protein [Microbacterium enclense]
MSPSRVATPPAHVPIERHMGATLAPRTAAVLRVLASRADAKGRAALDRDELARVTGLDALDVEIGLAIAQGRGVIERVRLTETTPGRVAVSAHFVRLS